MTAEPQNPQPVDPLRGPELTERVFMIAQGLSREGTWPSTRALGKILGVPHTTVQYHYRILVSQKRAQERPGGRVGVMGSGDRAMELLHRVALEAHRGQPNRETLREIDLLLGFGDQWGFPPVWTVME